MDWQKPKLAIFSLTRGYYELNDYLVLIHRNLAIAKQISSIEKYFDIQFLLAHEGNILISHQIEINRVSNLDIKYIDIKDLYTGWNDVNPFEIAIGPRNSFQVKGYRFEIGAIKGWPSGYRNMCHYYAIACIFQMHQLGFNYAFRIDEDCLIKSSLDQLNCLLDNKEFLLATPSRFEESHEITNQRLPKFLELTKLSFQDSWNDAYHENSPMLYSNLTLYNIDRLISSKEFNIFAKLINNSGVIHRYRFGDAPLLYWVSMLRKNGLFILDEIAYDHLSHKFEVSSGEVHKTA